MTARDRSRGSRNGGDGMSLRRCPCTVTHTARIWINRVRLPILLVVSWTGKTNISLSAFAPENLVSRDGIGSPVPRQPAHLHIQAESGAYLRDPSRVPRGRPLYILTALRHRVSPEFIGSRNRVPIVVHYRESTGTGPVNLKVVSNECCLGSSPWAN